ncbi:MAG TPA: phosphocholine cytidylyltransferase family protein [Kofleriaceae bacterium]|nr:phosphocholine cytidylyltransferase family protein [Kofleriaceae bacterium]
MRAVILAAGRGTRLEPLTLDLPKCLVHVGGVALIDRMIARLGEAGIDSVVVVSGHAHDALERHLRASAHPLAKDAAIVFNERYAEWGNFYSLLVAQDHLRDQDYVRLDGDVLLGPGVMSRVIAARAPLALAIDTTVALGDEEMKARIDGQGRVFELNKRIAPVSAQGEFIGVDRVSATMAPAVFAALRRMIDQGETNEYYERAYERLMEQGVEVGVADVSGCVWCEIDDAADLERATRIVERGLA